MKIITVRHGETEANKANLLQDGRDPLTDKGIKQAKKVAQRLKEEKIDVIYTSDFKRASDTAKEIAKYHDCPVIEDKRLREQNIGEYEGRPFEEMKKDMSQTKNIETWRPKGGESLKNVVQRVIGFLKEIMEKDDDKTVLLVTHAYPKIAISRYMHDDWEYQEGFKISKKRNYWYENTAINEFELEDGKWKSKKLNCTRHLG